MAASPSFLALLAAHATAFVPAVVTRGSLSATARQLWFDRACPPLPAVTDPAHEEQGIQELLTCVYEQLNGGSTLNFYLRQYYALLERSSLLIVDFDLDVGNQVVSQVLQALEAVDRQLCVMRFQDCYRLADGQVHMVHFANRVCDALMALPMLDSLKCHHFFDKPSQVVHVLDRLLAVLEAVKGGSQKVGPRAAPDVLLPRPPGVLWSLGARMRYDDPCQADMAACLASNGWSGLLVEGDPSVKASLREHFRDRHNISILSQYVSPGSVAGVLDDAMWNSAALREREVDLLQIDIDNGDCDVLDALLSAGLRPRFLRAEYWNMVPPPFAYRQEFQHLSTEKSERYGTVFNWVGRGCSIQALVDLLAKFGYALFALDRRWDADFVRHDVVEDMGLQVLPSDLLEDTWFSGSGGALLPRLLNNHVFDALMVDPRILDDPGVPLADKEILLRWHLEMACPWNWTLTCPRCADKSSPTVQP